jgi:transcriptional regulator with XRE-family HTH domain
MSEQVKEIASRVRALREIEGVSVESMAQKLKVDEALYEAWESGDSDIPVGALHDIANRLKVDLAELITGEAPRLKTYCLTRAEHGPEVARRVPYKYRSLAHNFIHKKAEPFLVEVGPEIPGREIELNSHPGQEFDYVVEGRLLVSIGGRELELSPGDSLYFDSAEEHGMKALDGKRSRFLAVIL